MRFQWIQMDSAVQKITLEILLLNLFSNTLVLVHNVVVVSRCTRYPNINILYINANRKWFIVNQQHWLTPVFRNVVLFYYEIPVFSQADWCSPASTSCTCLPHNWLPMASWEDPSTLFISCTLNAYTKFDP
jgi:hypothetical protein